MLQNASLSTQGLQILEPCCHRVNFDFEALIDEVAPYLANHDSLADVKTIAGTFPGWLHLEATIEQCQPTLKRIEQKCHHNQDGKAFPEICNGKSESSNE